MHGCPWDVFTCKNAARGGHLDVLKYAHENGCPWDAMMCLKAASGGHLDVLEYLREHSCPWDRGSVRRAAEEHGQDHIVTWIENN